MGSARAPGFTLLEVVVVIAILGVMAALAVPNLIPVVERSKARGAAENLASFVDDARRRAMTSGRCHRVVVSGDTATVQQRSTPDCVNIALDTWIDAGSTRIEGFTLAVERVPLTVALADAVIFRPNSRLRGDGNLRVDNDGARIKAQMSSGVTGFIDIMSTGRMCATVAMTPPVALTAPPVCR